MRLQMISFVSTTKDRKSPSSLMNRNEIQQTAVTMLALLKKNEDALVDQVKTLIKNNRFYLKEVLSTEVDGWTPFHAFALKGCRKLVKLAIKAGVDVNLKMGQPEGVPGYCSALHLASYRGDLSIIEVLLSNEADVEQKDSQGKTAIYYASKKRNTLAVRALARAGAGLDDCEPDHKSMLSGRNNFRLLPFPGCSGMKR